MSRVLLFAAFASTATPGIAQLAANRAELIARMDQADANRDGAVTRAELIAWREGNFTRFDRNRDGALSDADVPTFLRGTSIGALFDQLKAQCDANRDERVTREEFVSAPAVLFDAADANGDNVLTRSERDAAVAAARATKG